MEIEKTGNGYMAHYSLFMYGEKLQCTGENSSQILEFENDLVRRLPASE